jgi:hypothetical protein
MKRESRRRVRRRRRRVSVDERVGRRSVDDYLDRR